MRKTRHICGKVERKRLLRRQLDLCLAEKTSRG
jgi:hypothetical protein